MVKDYTVIDLETTGFAPSSEIIQVGMIKVRDNWVSDTFTEYVRPKCPIPLNIQDMTGIKMTDVEDAEPIEVILPRILEFMGDDILMGHNIFGFDYPVLMYHAQKSGVSVELSLNGNRQGIDTLQITRQLFPDKKHNLGALIENLGIKLYNINFHRALDDCRATKALYDYCVNRYSLIMNRFTTRRFNE